MWFPTSSLLGKGLGGRVSADRRGRLHVARCMTPSPAGRVALKHGQTYNAHPVGCAAALAVQHVIRDEDCWRRVAGSRSATA